MQVKRHVAYKLRIKDLFDGAYKRGEGDWAPNYIEFAGKHVSRVNLIGIIVSKTADGRQALIDDGSSRISIRYFDEGPKIAGEIGDMVVVIGRPREFGNDRYIVPEIIKKTDKKWAEVRKYEVLKPLMPAQADAPEIALSPSSFSKVFQLIKEWDKGDGVDVQQMISTLKDTDCEKMIMNLLEAGEIFEIKPGRVKVLE